jgi:hypothetical protein
VKSVTVVFEIGVSPTGNVRITRLVATAYDELIPEATKVAAGSRFTPPLRNGKPLGNPTYPKPRSPAAAGSPLPTSLR